MTTYFVDTSALARRYFDEVGHKWVKQWTHLSAQNVLVISATTSVEMFSLIARRERERNISSATASRLRRIFLSHLISDYDVIRLTHQVLTDSRDLVTRYPLKALDSLQLACCIYAQRRSKNSIIFVGADKRLLAAAAAEGFATDDPSLHV